MQEQEVKAIVVACNTASAFALDEVRHELDIPILGVIEPGAKVAARITKNKRVGVIGTEGTIGSGIHEKYLKSWTRRSQYWENPVLFSYPWWKRAGCMTL